MTNFRVDPSNTGWEQCRRVPPREVDVPAERSCPVCGNKMTALDAPTEMGSAAKQYACRACALCVRVRRVGSAHRSRRVDGMIEVARAKKYAAGPAGGTS